MRKDQMGEQFNREAKQDWRIAAAAARITDENASSEASTRWGGVVAKKKVQHSRSRAMKEESLKHG